MRKFLEHYIPFFSKDDFFFAIEVFGEVLRASLLQVEPATKQVTVLASEQLEIAAEPPAAAIEMLPALLKKFRLPGAVRVLALLDYRRATTMSGSITLTRSDSQAEIRESELQNLITQALWKFANQERPRAAAKMGVPEVQAQLADADVLQVKLDHHRVVNPVGFTARTVELCCRETFVGLTLLQQLGAALTEDNIALVVEGPSVIAGLAARLSPQSSFLFIDVGVKETVVYRVNKLSCEYLDSFTWGTQTLLASVAQEFRMSEAAAFLLLEEYARGTVSRAVAKVIEQAASGELAMLSNGIAAHEPQSELLPVYVHASMVLPSFLFNRTFTQRLGLPLQLTAVNEQFIGQQTGFVVHLQNQRPSPSSTYNFAAVLAALSDWYAVSATPLLTKTAKQRVRWIQST